MLIILLLCTILVNGILSVEEFICENDKLSISCPKSSVIHIKYANYGRHISTICPKKGLDTNTNCSSTDATQILELRCNFKKRCTLLVSNRIFADSCVGTYKYLELDYNCIPDPKLEFEPPSELQYGFYSHSPPCRLNEEAKCEDTCFTGYCNKLIPRPVCRYRMDCRKRCECKQGYWRDPTTGNCVELENCPLSVTKTICENSTIKIKCPGFTTINIDYANFGRRNSTICTMANHDQNVDCSSNVTAIAQHRCSKVRDNTCILQASTELFKEPCAGTYKYLEIKYTCKPAI